MLPLYLPHVDEEDKYILFMSKYQDILVYFLLIWMGKKIL